MKSFLAQVAKEIYTKNQNSLSTLVIILPSKRAVTFLRNELLKLVEKATIAPKIISIEEFIQDLANLKLATNIQLSFEFYSIYKKLTPEDQLEDFHTFTSWSQTVLQDFNEIDRYLIDPKSFFSHLFHIKELDQFHWTNTENKTNLQLQYLKFWEKLYVYYTAFNNHLIQKGIGYQGMIYREANENIEHYIQSKKSIKHYLIGFNALNNAEKNIFQELLTNTEADIYWDIDAFFIEHTEHDAGLFLRKYKDQWPYFKQHPFKVISTHFQEEKNIQIIGVPKNIGQAKYVGNLLTQPSLDIKNTAIVLGNENLLNPILNSIPKTINKANITSGFPLELSPFAPFFEMLMEVWEKNKDGLWYYQDVIKILSNPIAHTFTTGKKEETRALIQKINKENVIYLNDETVTNISAQLFIPATNKTTNVIINNCIDIILALKVHYSNENQRNSLFLEYLYRFYEIFNQLNTFNQEHAFITGIRSLKKIYDELLSGETVDFKGEPLEGLQIMGMLESRNLDFDNVILTSVNEGILPAGKSNNSFIPFDLKVAFGLPTYKEKDAIYSYHFYRLLQRAKNIYLLYNTEPDVLEGGEKSRLLQQLTMLKQDNHHITQFIANPHIKNNKKELFQINKSNAAIQRLKEVANKGFSPTSLSNYIRNPLSFYTQTILGIKEIEEVEETIAANTLGTIVHDTLEALYKPLEGQFLHIEHIQQMRKNIEKLVAEHFSQSYTSTSNLQGKNLIAYHVAKRYIENFMNFEEKRLKKGKKIKILQIETKVKSQIKHPDYDFPIYIKGKVDRVEEVDGIINIIDYKTGKVEQKDVEIINWSALTEDYKYSKAFQILCYAYMMYKETPYNLFEGGIISFKNLQSEVIKFAKKDKQGKGAVKIYSIDQQLIETFEEILKNLIHEIFSEAIPFQEKEIQKHEY
ncbi:PD-(D/E)XK nuclease family protein [Galbibacter sp. PAP.153]|uniref:PD-(D/E)XK nuclease family protein n=1 Tax=Galbibacter sp. PAP.153 TaxID=3104623 RepID=UPI003008E3C6